MINNIGLMQQSILINGTPFFYEEKDLRFGMGPEITHEQAKEILFRMKSLLDEQGVRFWLIYGTLLGAVREHDFISYDYDVDIQTDEYDKLLAIIPWLDEQGMKLIRVQPQRVYTFSLGSVYIDIYIAGKAPFPLNLWCSWLNGNIVPTRLVFPLSKLEFLGEKFAVPAQPEKLMEFFYGKTWRTPIPGVHGQYDIYPVYLYRRYIKKWIGR